jgi:hypothetical protein
LDRKEDEAEERYQKRKKDEVKKKQDEIKKKGKNQIPDKNGEETGKSGYETETYENEEIGMKMKVDEEQSLMSDQNKE